jgi:hypothetical protein
MNPELEGLHIGIRLRISIPAGPILDADSDRLHYIAMYGNREPCRPDCLPGCDRHGWYELIPGREMPFTGAGDLKVEMRPVILPDVVPE